MAMAGATFVLIRTQILTADNNKDKTELNDSPFVEAPGGGLAMVYGRDGAPLVESTLIYLPLISQSRCLISFGTT